MYCTWPVCPLHNIQASWPLLQAAGVSQFITLTQVHTYEELTNSFRDVSSKCHSLISDGGKEITKLLSSSNRTLKVSKGAPAWKSYVDYIGDIVIDGLVECIIASVHRLTSQVRLNQ